MRNEPKVTLLDRVQAVLDEVWYGIRQHGLVLYILMLAYLVLMVEHALRPLWR